MAIPAEASDSAVAKTEFREILGALGITQHHVAKLFNVGARSIRRWRDGERRIPCGVDILLRLAVSGCVTIDQIEQAAVAIPARMTGSAKPGPPAPLLVSAPEQSAAAPAVAAALADPGPTTAEKVVGLGPGACRWPYGDPEHPDFHFCGRPMADKPPYCEHHHAQAHAAPQTGSGHGAPIGLVTHGWRSPTTKRLSTGV
jgi:hypothetical protein